MKEKDKKETKNKRSGLFTVLKPYKLIVAGLTIMALAGSGINLFIPRIIEKAIDAFSDNNFDVNKVVLQFVVVAAAIFIFTFLQGILQTLTAEKVAKDLRNGLTNKLSIQTFSYILKANPSKLLTNMTSDMDSVKMFVSQAFANIISSLFVIVGVTVLLISLNWKLALAVLVIVPIIAFSYYIIFSRVKVIFRKSRKVIDMLNRTINESILASALIRVINSQQTEIDKFLDKNVEARDIGLSIVKLFSMLVPVIMFVANLAVVIILALGGHFVVIDNMTLGEFAAFNSYVVMLIFPIMMIGFMSNIIASATASYERIQQVIETPDPAIEGTSKDRISGNIAINDVSLNYDGKPILKKVSFDIKAGSKTAIIGPTAAGKSQLLYLMSHLISPNSGKIEFDGRRIDDYSNEVLHQQIGFVFQDNIIFNTTLYENVAFNDNVNDEDLKKAMDTAELSEFVQTLPDGLETMVSERGTSLSGGQKQRIMLARALALNPQVLMLDDFTARVDRKTEHKILGNIQMNYPELTLISVTQKIEPIKDYDQIILLMEGEVVVKGTHDELKHSSPEYIQIYSSQKSTNEYEL